MRAQPPPPPAVGLAPNAKQNRSLMSWSQVTKKKSKSAAQVKKKIAKLSKTAEQIRSLMSR
jgi:hypothetical protein